MGAGVEGDSVYTPYLLIKFLCLFVYCWLGPDPFGSCTPPPVRINASLFVMDYTDFVEIETWVRSIFMIQASLHLKLKFQRTTVNLLKVLIVVFHIGALIIRCNNFTSYKRKFSVAGFAFSQLLLAINKLIVVDVCLSLNLVKSSARFFLENRRLFRLNNLKNFCHPRLHKLELPV